MTIEVLVVCLYDCIEFFMKLFTKVYKFLPIFILKFFLGLFVIRCASLFKMSFIFGSYRASFAATTIAKPLIGLFSGGFISIVIFSLCLLFRYLLFGVASLHILAFYIPGLCSALYLAYDTIFVRFFLPLLCIILFVTHAIGAQAFAYSLYWLIPIVIYCVKQKNMFLNVLGSTFVAHAVGSTIWLYTIGMNASVWNALIPIVALERLSMALAIWLGYKIIVHLKKRSLTSIFVLKKTEVTV